MHHDVNDNEEEDGWGHWENVQQEIENEMEVVPTKIGWGNTAGAPPAPISNLFNNISFIAMMKWEWSSLGLWVRDVT
jgi:hypothetical protein